MINARDFETDDQPLIPYKKMHAEVDQLCDTLNEEAADGIDEAMTNAIRLFGHLVVDIADSLDSMAVALGETTVIKR